jgi:WD40 repeat protein
MAWSPAGDAIYANGFNEVAANTTGSGAIGVWDIAGDKLSKTLINAEDTHDYIYTGQLSLNPEGTLLLISAPYMAARTLGFVSLYDVAANKLLDSWDGLYLDNDTAKAQESIQGAAFSPDGSQFAVVGSLYIRIFDTASREMTTQFPVNARGGTVNSGDEKLDVTFAWSPDGTRLAWQVLGNLAYYDLTAKSATVLKSVEVGAIPVPNKGLAWSPDGKLIVYEKSKALQIIPVATSTPVTTLAISGSFEENHVKNMAFSPDVSMVAFCASEYVAVWRLSDKKLVFDQKITNPSNEIDRYEEVAWSPDSKSLAVLSYGDKQILIYKIGQ